MMPGLVITWLLSEVYDKNKNVTEGKKKKLKSLFGFLSANKIDTYNKRGQKRFKKIQTNLQNKSKTENNKGLS